MCTAPKKRRMKVPIKEEKVPIKKEVTKVMSYKSSVAEGVDSVLGSLGMPRTRHYHKGSGAALIRRRLMILIQENARLKLVVARQKEEISVGAADLARVSGELAVTTRRFDLMIDTRDWVACARMANSTGSLPPTVVRRVREARGGSHAAPEV